MPSNYSLRVVVCVWFLSNGYAPLVSLASGPDFDSTSKSMRKPPTKPNTNN